jgi:hypothetical protein
VVSEERSVLDLLESKIAYEDRRCSIGGLPRHEQ